MPKPSGNSETAVEAIEDCLNSPYSFWLRLRVSRMGQRKGEHEPQGFGH